MNIRILFLIAILGLGLCSSNSLWAESKMMFEVPPDPEKSAALGLEWPIQEFEVVETQENGKVVQKGTLEGIFTDTENELVLGSGDPIEFVESVDPKQAKDKRKFKVPVILEDSHAIVKLLKVDKGGDLTPFEVKLMVPQEEARSDLIMGVFCKDNHWDKQAFLSSSASYFSATTPSGGSASTEFLGNHLRLGGQLSYCREKQPTSKIQLEYFMKAELGYTTPFSGLVVPVAGSIKPGVMFRNQWFLNKDKTIAVSPLAFLEYEGINVASSIPSSTAITYEVRSLAIFSLGLGARLQIVKPSRWWEIHAHLSRSLVGSSALSTTGTSGAEGGWKFELRAFTPIWRKFALGASLTGITYSGQSTVTGGSGSLIVNYRF